MNRLYICNGEKPDCKKTFCAWCHEDGECFHTLNEEYALNPEEIRRFEKIGGEEWETMRKRDMLRRMGFGSSTAFCEDEEADAEFCNSLLLLRNLFRDYHDSN